MQYPCKYCGTPLASPGICNVCQYEHATQVGKSGKAQWGWKKMLAFIISVLGALFLFIIIAAR